MNLMNLEKIFKNKYNHLLIGEILIMLLYPVLKGFEVEFPVAGCLFLIAIIPALHVVLPFKVFLPLMSLAVLGLVLRALAASEKTVVAKTPVRVDKIYQIGFHVHMLNPQDWDPSGSMVTLLVEPIEDGGPVP